jgi:hypothetical protein
MQTTKDSMERIDLSNGDLDDFICLIGLPLMLQNLMF